MNVVSVERKMFRALFLKEDKRSGENLIVLPVRRNQN